MRSFKFPFPKYSIAFLIAIFFLVFCSGEPEYLPESIQGMKLNKELSGNEAVKYIDKLHFNQVAAGKKNDIGFYEGGVRNSTIYVTYYSTAIEAKTDFDKMTKKISPENSVFISPAFIEIEGINIYRCFGMGQTHFVFAHNKVLLWVSTDTVSGRNFLKEYINIIR